MPVWAESQMIEERGEGSERGGGEGGETVDGRREEAKQSKTAFSQAYQIQSFRKYETNSGQGTT